MKNKKKSYFGHRQRLKERFLISESKGMLDYELLELLLTYAIPVRDVKEIAKNLIKTFRNLSNVLDAEPHELKKVKGVGEQSCILIKLFKQLSVRYFETQVSGKNVVSDPECVTNFAKMKLGGLKYEVFMLIFVNVKNEVLQHVVINEGTIDQAIIYPRKILEQALQYNAAGIVIFHNHPSGHCFPSESDQVITIKLKDSLKTIDVKLLDHIIVSKSDYYSFQEEGDL